MLIERNAFDKNGATTVTELRDTCLGCKDCSGPCHTLMQLCALPEILLANKGANA